MTPTSLFYIIITIIIVNFIIDKILDALNAKRYGHPIPSELEDVYDEEEYKKSQSYKTTNYKFGLVDLNIFYHFNLGVFTIRWI